MDRKIIKKKSYKPYILWGTSFIILACLIFYIANEIFGKKKLHIPANRLTISEVKSAKFQEFVALNGIVLPIATIFLDAEEGGRVEGKYAEDGATLKKGDPILKLENPDLELSLSNQETAVYAQQTQMQISANAAQQNTIYNLNQMTDAAVALKESERIYRLNKKLLAHNAVAKQEYIVSENNYKYHLDKYSLAKKILVQDSLLRIQQRAQTIEQKAQMNRTLALMRKKVAGLIVRAPIDGQLTSLDVEVGQNKNKGEHLGQIDVLLGHKVRVEIDEHYITKIYPGLKADLAYNDSIFGLIVKKVFTQVKTGGTFLVDLSFVGKKPVDIRKGQTLQVRIYFSGSERATLIPKGGFFEKTGGNWIFKLSADGRTAYRTSISISRQNPDYYEVKSGLTAGEKVITSSYDDFGDIKELIFK